jgi:hypothetical protein
VSDGFTTSDLLRYAEGHRRSAAVLFDIQDPECFDSAAYLSHLGIELVLKAAILHYSGSFPKSHDLLRLLDELKRLSDFIWIPDDEVGTLRYVNLFSAVRYPTPPKAVEVGDEMAKPVDGLYALLYDKMPRELRDKQESYDPLSKGGRMLMYRRPRQDAEEPETGAE